MKSFLKNSRRFRWQRLALDLGYEGDEELISQADELADTQIRFPAFLLTTHHWEGRWLMDMASIDDLQEEKKKKALKGNRPLATSNENHSMCGDDMLYARQYADK